jgi:ABC-2 type transport system permease protein
VTTLFYTTGLVIFLGLMCVLPGLALFGSGDLIIHHYGKFGIVFIPEVEIPARMFFAFMAAIWSMTAVASIAFLLSTLVENSIGTMAVVIVFLVIGNFPFDFFSALKPYLFTTYMVFWQRFLDDPIPWQEIAKSATILGLHSLGLFFIAFGAYARKDIKT